MAELDAAAREIPFDSSYPLLSGDHIHAAREVPHHVDAQLVGGIFIVAVTQRDDPRLPTSPVVTARQGPDGVNELMVRIGHPMRGLAAPPHHHTRPVRRQPR